MSKRWMSRKFITSLAAQVAAVVVLLWPQHQPAIVQASESIAALLVLVLSALGYVHAEASVDRQREASKSAAKP